MSENRRRERNKLSTRLVQTITTPGRHSDGGGLYLIVDKSGARRWLFIFRWKGRQPEMGLGGFPATSLANARKQALEAEALVRSGINPIEHRKAQNEAKSRELSFAAVIDKAVPTLTGNFRNEKHKWQWAQTLSDDFIPHLPDYPSSYASLMSAWVLACAPAAAASKPVNSPGRSWRPLKRNWNSAK
jgi:hypothetical protein